MLRDSISLPGFSITNILLEVQTVSYSLAVWFDQTKNKTNNKEEKTDQTEIKPEHNQSSVQDMSSLVSTWCLISGFWCMDKYTCTLYISLYQIFLKSTV